MVNVKSSQSGFRLVALPIFIIALFFMMFAGDSYTKLFVNACIAFALALIFFQMLAIHKERGKNWIQVDLLFMIMFFITHFWMWVSLQMTDAAVLGWYAKSSSQVDYTVAIILAAMSAFTIGFNVLAKKKPAKIKNSTNNRNWLIIGYFVFYTGVGLVLSYAVYFGADAFKGSYAGSSVGEQGSRNVYLLQSIFLNLGIAIILIVNTDINKRIPKAKVSVIVFLLVLLMYLILGDRSEFIFSAAIFAFVYSRHYKSISFKYLMGGIVAISILMSAVQVARRADERSLTAIVDAMFVDDEEVSATAGLDNLGASGLVTLVAVQSVPKEHDYFYGQLKKLELMGVIPFGRRLFLSEEDSKLPYSTTSDFLTWKILGPRSATGTGTTIVADLYIDFGVVGVMLGLAFLGYLARVIQEKANRSESFIWSVVFCYFAGLLVILPRYSFLKIIRGVLWPILLLLFLQNFSRSGKRNS